jgi:hypothetical protein
VGLDSAALQRLHPSRTSPQRASLLPKVRDQFAEFLNQGSLVRLGLLNQPTSVGVRYGQVVAPLQAFRACSGVGDLRRGLRHPLVLASQLAPTSLNGPRLTTRHPPQDLAASLPRPGAGISTCCPSPTPRGLGLGPTNPLRSVRAAEALGLRRWGFSPHVTLLIPTFALVFAPQRLPLLLHRLTTLPYHQTIV